MPGGSSSAASRLRAAIREPRAGAPSLAIAEPRPLFRHVRRPRLVRARKIIAQGSYPGFLGGWAGWAGRRARLGGGLVGRGRGRFSALAAGGRSTGPDSQRLTERSEGFWSPDPLSAAAKGGPRKSDRENSGCEGDPASGGSRKQWLRRGSGEFRKHLTAAAEVFQKFRKGPTAAARGGPEIPDPLRSGCGGGVPSGGWRKQRLSRGSRIFATGFQRLRGGSEISGSGSQRLSSRSRSFGNVPQRLRRGRPRSVGRSSSLDRSSVTSAVRVSSGPARS